MSHTYHALNYHIVFSTKNRERFLTHGVREAMHAYIGGIIKKQFGVPLIVGGVSDHVHILAGIKPAFSIAEVMREVKACSSKWLHEEDPAFAPFAWQTGYGVFSVSRSVVPTVERYIRGQEAHHKQVSFKDELVRFLEKHGIEYDPRYVWD